MQQLIRNVMIGIALQGSVFALSPETNISEQQDSTMTIQSEYSTIEAETFKDKSAHHSRSRHHGSDHCGPPGPQGPNGPQGEPGQAFGEYASFFLTTSSGDVDLIAGENLIFNSQVTLSGIGYDSTTGVFTLGPGTYSVIYFFAPFSIPSLNMYVNGQLVLNSPLGGSSTVLTLTEPSNTLVLQAISTDSFSAPGANQSWASIAIFRID